MIYKTEPCYHVLGLALFNFFIYKMEFYSLFYISQEIFFKNRKYEDQSKLWAIEMYDDILLIKRDNKNIIDMNPVSL